jgi:hypothetical protein
MKAHAKKQNASQIHFKPSVPTHDISAIARIPTIGAVYRTGKRVGYRL